MDQYPNFLIPSNNTEAPYEKVIRLRLELHQAESELAFLLENCDISLKFNLPNGLMIFDVFKRNITFEYLISWLKQKYNIKRDIMIVDPKTELAFNYLPLYTLFQLGFIDGYTYDVRHI